MIGDYTNQDFIILDLADSLGSTRTKLLKNPGFWAIILEDKVRPVTLFTREDLDEIDAFDNQPLVEITGQLPPCVVVPNDVFLEDFVESDEYVVFSLGARGAIVYDETKLIGVLPEATIGRFLAGEFQALGGLKGFPSDTILPGNIVNNPIIMHCTEFNHRNELAYFNRHKPPQCQNKKPHPHPIRK